MKRRTEEEKKKIILTFIRDYLKEHSEVTRTKIHEETKLHFYDIHGLTNKLVQDKKLKAECRGNVIYLTINNENTSGNEEDT